MALLIMNTRKNLRTDAYQVWLHKPVISATHKLQAEGCMFKACLKKQPMGVCEMAQWLEVLATMPNDLSLTHMVGGKNSPPNVLS